MTSVWSVFRVFIYVNCSIRSPYTLLHGTRLKWPAFRLQVQHEDEKNMNELNGWLNFTKYTLIYSALASFQNANMSYWLDNGVMWSWYLEWDMIIMACFLSLIAAFNTVLYAHPQASIRYLKCLSINAKHKKVTILVYQSTHGLLLNRNNQTLIACAVNVFHPLKVFVKKTLRGICKSLF